MQELKCILKNLDHEYRGAINRDKFKALAPYFVQIRILGKLVA